MIEKSPKSEIQSRSNQPDASAAAPKPSAHKVEARSSDARGTLYEVEIAGIPLRLKSTHDVQTVDELVALVDRKIREALPLTKTGSIQNAAILAALHMAEEYLLLKRKAKVELDGLEAKTLKVISELESSRVNTGLNN